MHRNFIPIDIESAQYDKNGFIWIKKELKLNQRTWTIIKINNRKITMCEKSGKNLTVLFSFFDQLLKFFICKTAIDIIDGIHFLSVTNHFVM